MRASEQKPISAPCCSAKNMVVGPCYRFSVLTPQLIRMEYAPDGRFEDRPTQLAVNRLFPDAAFEVYETDSLLEIRTAALNVFYDKGPFTKHGLQVKVRSECDGLYCTWNYSEPVTDTLGGTARTLDCADGEIPLDPGIQSRMGGFGVLDDSRSAVIQPDGSIRTRAPGVQDLYFFGYGFSYRKCLHDFFHLSGSTPLLPRYALGNWWSRFHPYTDEEYLALMARFRENNIPLAVAVIDMDWHLRQIDPNYGKGWTGFTWNRDLIREPERFLSTLHSLGLKTTLNLHPAEGIQPHEEMYSAMSRALHRDPAEKRPIRFDFCDADFIRAYFQHTIHPLEAQGVDFWWLDWQQGTTSRTPDIDPLWLLNYYHFRDADSGNQRPMILSRYAGPGSHRFPIGFSGDSIISWKSLDFQPRFTATAANIGYGWWSHDIGGHQAGSRDVVLQTRWLQLGVFSPIFRLHSTSNPFNGKEPWRYPEPAQSIMADFMRLRHRLVPYLYTMNWRCHTQDVLLVEPMYYRYPKEGAAYSVKNQYAFGSELLVCPITEPNSPVTGRGSAIAWLPEADYFDFFTGIHYRGGRSLCVYRPLETIPVFAEAGAIVPMTAEGESCQNGTPLPAALSVRVFGGADGEFCLYEDDGLSKAFQTGAHAATTLRFRWRDENGASTFSLVPELHNLTFLPANRAYTLCFTGVCDCDGLLAACDGRALTAQKSYDAQRKTLCISVDEQPISAALTLTFPGGLTLAKNHVQEDIYTLLNDCAIAYTLKERIYNTVLSFDTISALGELQTMQLAPELLGALTELLTAE